MRWVLDEEGKGEEWMREIKKERRVAEGEGLGWGWGGKGRKGGMRMV